MSTHPRFWKFNIKRYHIHFEGRVQGVGFRATTRSIARDFQVVGQVRNLPDRSVELIIEGEPEQLNAMLAALLKRMGNFITRHTVDHAPASGEYGEPGPRGKVTIDY